jgi:hypothetical protein
MNMPTNPRSASLQGVYETINASLVAIYKLLGFVVLLLIVLGVVGYIGLNVFYFVNHGWATPAIVSPTDPRVLDLSARLAQHAASIDQLSAESADIEAKLKTADLTIALEGRHLQSLERSIAHESLSRRRDLVRLRSLQGRLLETQKRVGQSSSVLGDLALDKLSSQFAANLIDQHDFAAGNYQLAQMATTDLSLEDRGTRLDAELERIRRDLGALRSLTAKSPQPLTVEAARMLHELETAELNLDSAVVNRDALFAAKAALEKSKARYDQLLKTIEVAPLLRALRQRLTVAFVPYENLGHASKGTPVFACRVAVVWCSRVATVGERLEGEVIARHPLFGTDTRGQMVELEFTAPERAEEQVLFLGRAPLGI